MRAFTHRIGLPASASLRRAATVAKGGSNRQAPAACTLAQSRKVSFAGQGWPPRVRLRGLPFRASEDDVRSFFDGFELAAPDGESSSNVDIILRSEDGLPTGQALVYFDDWDEACRARTAKQRGYIGTRFIEIYVDWSP
mmetsp:Transcript_63474/g.147945  ORF Transcript_63474/g.147945 Transcript_63474/m.147945 type:complete len:139 (+) Transcript_63474:64-480(+)